MGYKNVVSANRLLNRDVKAFPTQDDFGGGSNDQYKLLRNYSAASYEDNIRYADVPFVYANGNRVSPAVEALRRSPMQQKPIAEVGKPPIDQPVVRQVQPQQSIPYMQPVNQTPYTQQNNNAAVQNGFVPLKQNNVKPVQQNKTNNANTNIPSGFVPVKKNSNNR